MSRRCGEYWALGLLRDSGCWESINAPRQIITYASPTFVTLWHSLLPNEALSRTATPLHGGLDNSEDHQLASETARIQRFPSRRRVGIPAISKWHCRTLVENPSV